MAETLAPPITNNELIPLQPNRPEDIQIEAWQESLTHSMEAASQERNRAEADFQQCQAKRGELYSRETWDANASAAEKVLTQELWDSSQRIEDARIAIIRRRTQLELAEKGDALVYASESPRLLDTYFSPYDTLGPEFAMPPTDNPTRDPDEVVQQLNTLPFVPPEDIQKPARTSPQIILRGAQVPVNRIISADTFAAWSGRGTYRAGIAGYIHEPNGQADKDIVGHPEFPRTSAGAIAAYADRAVDDSGANITVVKDPAGAYWGLVTDEGAHRLAIAKLRGQEYVQAYDVTIPAEADMPTLPFSVREQFANGQNRIPRATNNSQVS